MADLSTLNLHAIAASNASQATQSNAPMASAAAANNGTSSADPSGGLATDLLIAAGGAGSAGILTLGAYALYANRAAQTSKIVPLPGVPRDYEQSSIHPHFTQAPGSNTCGFHAARALLRLTSVPSSNPTEFMRKRVADLRSQHSDLGAELAVIRANNHDPDAIGSKTFTALYNEQLEALVKKYQAQHGKNLSVAEVLQKLQARFLPPHTDDAGLFNVDAPERAHSAAHLMKLLKLSGDPAATHLPTKAFAVLTIDTAKIPYTEGESVHARVAKENANDGKIGHWVILAHEPHVTAGREDGGGYGWFLIDSARSKRELLSKTSSAQPTVAGAAQALQDYLGTPGDRLNRLNITPGGARAAHVHVAIPHLERP